MNKVYILTPNKDLHSARFFNSQAGARKALAAKRLELIGRIVHVTKDTPDIFSSYFGWAETTVTWQIVERELE